MAVSAQEKIYDVYTSPGWTYQIVQQGSCIRVYLGEMVADFIDGGYTNFRFVNFRADGGGAYRIISLDQAYSYAARFGVTVLMVHIDPRLPVYQMMQEDFEALKRKYRVFV